MRLLGYELLEPIGQGPWCTVWRCRREGETERAMKRLELRNRDDPARASRFEEEACLARSLDHPNIVRVHDVAGRDRTPQPFFVMDLLPGGSVARYRGLDLSQVPHLCLLFARLCGALEHVHRRGLVHCDVKPSNLLFDASGTPFLTDFGMAASADRLAQAGTTGGTLGYMAPEQLESFTRQSPPTRPLDGRADLYALGEVFYELITGEPAFKASNRFSLLYQRAKSAPRPPTRVRPGLPPELDAVVLRALTGAPEGRYPTAGDFGAALAGVGGSPGP